MANITDLCCLGFGVPVRGRELVRSNVNAAFPSLVRYKTLRKFHDKVETRRLCFRDSVNPKGRGIIRAMASPAVSAPKREKDPKKRVVITGMGIVSVFGNGIDLYYDKLLDGESGIGPIDRFDASGFPVQFAGQIRDFSSEGYIPPRNEGRIDDYMRYCIVAGKKALENANLGPQVLETMDKTRIGVLVGSGIGGVSNFMKGIETGLEKEVKKMSPFFIPFTLPNMGSAVLAIETGLMGPTYSISTGCATSNHCFIAAANEIKRGDADIMVAGGSEACIVPPILAGFIACGGLSRRNEDPVKASSPFDTDRDGFVIGEGSGVLVMESLESAMKRGANIMAEFLGGGMTSDAHNIITPRLDSLGVIDCITKSLECARVSPEEVNYVNCHATSTKAGDLAEIIAIKQVFNNNREMKINATKSMIGHGLAAAGGLEAIATVKAINTGWLHPTLNQNNLMGEVTFDTVPNVKKRHQVNVAISNSLGMGGHNAVIVLAPFKPLTETNM